ncbi:16S rRNA (guanine(966)-N(2))-methyltransferase RsmD [Halomonas elongata]|uniref:Ribosomal RNA small subunit methyltransferase D n=1 Tax=Halomonas elongata (strain ATCC 33173 / DSM 2581 / NBRC 15536 / NCIMB 2198 / 1H9) TaxID=768066 RepID=E1V948_HALED|nr:16S rRNA (guanine(966)-N(2))-methyltransferase RsmD [Halomonas elongata]WBF17460.1 16S rRNA (guanine(966)-N(2))-methyltransferase RsmD [Halomonas elongata]WPU46299.1 16S rRNA (guanine(966)-N(2))-methyltransferase RsmD [Halomonas elongata DSM 2581]CBV43720.1 16S rRNA (guanine(966)-N(2))-methyltransferase RsmD [Halomonas elongata DSM 2581]
MTRRRSPSRPSRHSRAPRRRDGNRGRGQLRIIGGEYRRRLLPVIDLPGLRPTPDRVRETLFNWLGPGLAGARVLDLFAGTGALGLEALSRGAHDAILVELDARASRALEDNLATLGITHARVVNADVMRFLDAEPTPHSLVFLDPPFRQDLAAACCAALEGGWLSDDASIYLETESTLAPEVPANWILHREVRAGDSTGRLYRRRPTGEDSPTEDAC